MLLPAISDNQRITSGGEVRRNNKGGGKVTNCHIDRDEFTITIDIDDAKFEMTYGQAALILMALKGIYNK